MLMFRKSISKKVILLVLTASLVMSMAGCSTSADKDGGDDAPAAKTKTKTAAPEEIAGTINAGGSTSVEKAALKAL